MSAKFNIINLALRRLGQDPIATLGEDTENYRKVDDIYDLDLKSFLRSHPWGFNKKEATLASSGTPVLSDFKYMYQLPADFLRLNKTSVEPDYSHKIKGKKLYSNANAVKIEYGYFCKDPDAWVTSHAYTVGDFVLNTNTIYYCLITHSSAGLFATDLAAAKWVEEDIYDPSFTDAFATLLAYDLCMPITKDADLKEVLGNELIVKTNKAKSLNGQESTPDEGQQDEWINSRI